jgi:hypothetical protein
MNRADIVRSSYRLVLRMHPAKFRERFGDEMLWIFDEERHRGAGTRLFFDGVLSVLRQRWKVEKSPAQVVAGFGLLDTGWGIAPRRFVEAGITASFILAGFMLLLEKTGKPSLTACSPAMPRAASARIQAPSRISAVPITVKDHSRVDSGKIDSSAANAVRIVHATESVDSSARYCPTN